MFFKSMITIFLISIASASLASAQISSWKEIRDHDVTRQKWDFSCGPASIATLIKILSGTYVGERQLISEFFESIGDTDQQKIVDQGFSLTDLEVMAERQGFHAEGVRLAGDSKLHEIGRPALLYLEVEGFRHFAVYLAHKEGMVLLADPAQGNVWITVEALQKAWSSKAALYLWTDESRMPIVSDGPSTRGLAARTVLVRQR